MLKMPMYADKSDNHNLEKKLAATTDPPQVRSIPSKCSQVALQALQHYAEQGDAGVKPAASASSMRTPLTLQVLDAPGSTHRVQFDCLDMPIHLQRWPAACAHYHTLQVH